MKTLVVLFALAAVGCCSWVPLAQPDHHPALVLDPHGRPLDTAEVINARALHLQAKALEGHDAHIAHAVVAAPAAVSHQSRVDVISSPSVVSHGIVAPVVAHTAYATPLLAHSTHDWAGYGHLLKKRSVAHEAYYTPIIAPSAVSHQSRVDVISSPAVVSHAIAAPVVAHAVAAPVVAIAPSAVSHQSRVDVRTSPAVVSHSVVAPITHSVYAAPWAHSVWAGHDDLAHGHLLKKRSLAHVWTPVVHTIPAAVSHQSRVDVISSPAVVSHSVVAPIAHSIYAAPWAHSVWAGHDDLAHGHLLKKRSLAQVWTPVVHTIPAAVSHQSRVDVISKPAVVSHAIAAPVFTHAAPVAVAHVAPAAVSHQSRVDVISSGAHLAPVAHSVWAAPLTLAHAGLLKASHW